MALNDASGGPLALNSVRHRHLSASGNTSTPVSNGQDPLTAASSGDCLSPDGHEDVMGKDAMCNIPQKQQRSDIVQRTNRSSQNQNGSEIKQNGSLRNLPPSSFAASPAAITDSQRLAKCHLLSTLSPASSSSPVQPLQHCCQHCHFHSTLCCPCGHQECQVFQKPGTGPGPGSVSHPGATASCPCCLSACTYSHHQLHTPHSPSPLCLHHHHQQRWQEHLQNQTTGIR